MLMKLYHARKHNLEPYPTEHCDHEITAQLLKRGHAEEYRGGVRITLKGVNVWANKASNVTSVWDGASGNELMAEAGKPVKLSVLNANCKRLMKLLQEAGGVLPLADHDIDEARRIFDSMYAVVHGDEIHLTKAGRVYLGIEAGELRRVG